MVSVPARRNQVSVIGLGYIGLPTAAFLASTGLKVLGCDINKNRVDTINSGVVPFVEPGFEKLLADVVRDGTLTASTEPTPSDAFIIAVPTPFKEGKTVDDQYVMAAAETIAPLLRGNELVILESTSPPGLTEAIGNRIIELRPDLTLEPNAASSIYLAHAPERVLPGRIMEEMTANARIVGGLNNEASERVRSLYARFCDGEILITDARTAEMAKLTENAFRDVNIAFANELSLICDDLDINVWELIELANHHPRVNILQPGPGVGGHCIAVDPWFIVSSSPKYSNLIKTAREVNDSKPEFVLNQVAQLVAEQKADGRTPSIAALGLAFKPNIDDLRESPSLEIVERLSADYPDIKLNVVEPNISELPNSLEFAPNVSLRKLNEALTLSTIVLLLVDHKEFKFNRSSIQNHPALVDTRGLTAGN